ncbi:hypothetical protein wCauA_06310 [Wolbachia endosymbiont of Carposina sasakii]|nr:hypothetical protein [Wolbachia endosymbiont of Kradibia gibbosae]QDH19364.1 hypothetical protein wCauA_06310 [Wolbachia endosymbiont of Carposina sasakii]
MPVPRHWKLHCNEHIEQLYNKNWIPVSATCMTPS